MSNNPVLATLEHVWQALDSLGHPIALMGGLSVAAWGHLRTTRDVDLL
jgi:hypothetical protein